MRLRTWGPFSLARLVVAHALPACHSVDAAAVTQLLQPHEGGAPARCARARILPAMTRHQLGRDLHIVEGDDLLMQYRRQPLLLELAPFGLRVLLCLET